MNPGAIGDFGPRLRRPEEDIPELMYFGADPTWIVEGARIDGPGIGSPFECEADFRSAFWAEIKLQPTSRFIRNGPVVSKWFANDLDLFLLEHGCNGERCPSSALTPSAMTNGYKQRIAMRRIPHGTAQAAAFVCFRHKPVLLQKTADTQNDSLSGRRSISWVQALGGWQ